MYGTNGRYFNAFLAMWRANRNVTLEQLGMGLCSVSMLKKVETGERFPNKMLQDRLLGRLGMDCEGLEDILWPDDYSLWQNRQELLHAIEDKDVEMAEKMISLYGWQDIGNDKIERQFYLVMQAQVLQYQNVGQEKLRALFREALDCTLPGLSIEQWKRRPMAVQEWNLLLEYVRCGGDVGQVPVRPGDTYQAAAYESLLSALCESGMDAHCCVKVFPKAVYYLCLERMKLPQADRNYGGMLQVCGSAVELLRSTMRMYYFYELLEMMERVHSELQRGTRRPASPKVQGILPEQVLALRKALEKLYDDRHVSIRMENCVYLYSQAKNHNVGEVVRKRRNRMGMSVKELCKGICDEKTIRRLESGKYKTQRQIIVELFERLEVEPECLQQSITDKKDKSILQDEFAKALKNRDMDAVNKTLLRMKVMPSERVISQQGKKCLESLFLWYFVET